MYIVVNSQLNFKLMLKTVALHINAFFAQFVIFHLVLMHEYMLMEIYYEHEGVIVFILFNI